MIECFCSACHRGDPGQCEKEAWVARLREEGAIVLMPGDEGPVPEMLRRAVAFFRAEVEYLAHRAKVGPDAPEDEATSQAYLEATRKADGWVGLLGSDPNVQVWVEKKSCPTRR